MKTTALFVYSILFTSSMLSLYNGVTAQNKSCPLGMFCPIDVNCMDNTPSCVVVCPTETDHMQQGNHLTGNCERVPKDADHWMDSTHYEICIPTNQALNIDIRDISLIITDQIRTNNYTYNDLPDVTFTLNGSCPYFYFTNMFKKILTFENYYDFYIPDLIETASLAIAKPVPPGDYEMQVIVTIEGSVIEKSDITVYVRDIQLCETSLGVTCQYNNRGCGHACSNTGTGVNCTCLDGHQLINDQTCTDTDECSTGDHNCTRKQHQQCANRPSSYECACANNYELLNGTCNELTCQRDNGRCDHVCSDAEIGVNCSCHDGYQLVDNQACIDIDECSTAAYSCAQNQECVNRPGTFSCECVSGYELLNGMCEDIDECLDNNGTCSHMCINTEGSYHCACHTGYALQPDNHNCKANCLVIMLDGRIKVKEGRRRAILRFSSNGDSNVTFRCKLNNGNFKECTSPMKWKNLKRRSHTVIVKAFCFGNQVARKKFQFQIS